MSASVETQLKKAQKALASHQLVEARDAFSQVLARFPGNLRARRGLWVSQSALADAGFATNHPPRQQLDEIAAALGGGRAADAVSLATPLLARCPRGHGLPNLLGVALATTGDEDGAIAAFRAAVELKPNFLEARANLAGRIMAKGDFEAALSLVGDSLEMVPEDGASLNAMTVCLIGLRRFDEALAIARRAVKARPDEAEPHNNLGLCLRHLGQIDDAITSYRKALDIAPDFADAILNLGVALVRSGQAGKAIDIYQRGIDVGVASAKLHSNLGLALIETRQLEQAIAAFDKALDLDPDHIDASFNKFIALALGGQMDLAWPHAECRFDSRRAVPVDRRYHGNAPAWDGTASLAGRTLLVHAEQGLGDTLMFLRLMSDLPAEAAQIRLAVQPQLYDLIAAQTAGFDVVALEDGAGDDQTVPDFHCPLMSLPFLLRTGGTGMVPRQPYLSVPEAHRTAWQDRLGTADGARVGFVFRGNPDHVNDSNRSLDLEQFLTALPAGPSYHYLGIELRTDEQRRLARRDDIRTHCDHLADFRDTAALVAQMDRVLCVDTSVAHLAGALGVETHILLPFTPDWRWGLEVCDTPWYPSVTLHRQAAPGDWQPVLSALHDMLAAADG